MLRVESVWTGGPLGTGLTVMNLGTTTTTSTTVTDALAAVRAFWNSLAGLIPTPYTITVSSTADLIDETNGTITSTVSGTPPTPVAGSSGAPAHAAGVGVRVRWQTNDYVRGRRCVGTTFVVPIAGNGYETNGTIAAANITILQNAGTALITALGTATHPMGVWTRPTSPTASDGEWHQAFSATVPDQASWLTTRRA